MKFSNTKSNNQRKNLSLGINGIHVKFLWVISFMILALIFPPSKSYSQNVVKAKKGDVEILHTPNNDEPEANLTSHKYYDVEAFRLLFDEPFMGKGKQVYSIRYYMIGRNDSLDCRKAWIGTDENYDKLSYNWLNDSTVTIRIYDSITSKGDTFQLFSSNGSNGIRTEEDIISQ